MKDKQIIVVSGLPRSGTSMMMNILYQSGIAVLTDNIRKADENNPAGYFEFEPVKKMASDVSWIHLAENKAVKIIAQLLKYLPPAHRYKIIFMQRDIAEVIASQQKMLGKNTNAKNTALLAETFLKQIENITEWLNKQANIETIFLNHKEIIYNSTEALNKLSVFLNNQSILKSGIKAIEPNLHRNKLADKT